VHGPALEGRHEALLEYLLSAVEIPQETHEHPDDAGGLASDEVVEDTLRDGGRHVIAV
jgi:hypothetical protein